MSSPKKAPYGTWKSPIPASSVAADTIGLEQVVIDGEDIYWLEVRPFEGGRRVLVVRTLEGRVHDLTPQPYSVRSRVHEYGGGAFAVADGTIYFSNARDQRLYRQAPDSEPQPITPAGACRYADSVVDRQRNRIICVCEDHEGDRDEPINSLVAVSVGGSGEPTVLVSGNDFYSNPQPSPDGKQVAWLTWNHPNMPWDGTELWVGTIAKDGSVGGAHRIAGAPDESIFQPQWSPDGVLFFVSDRSGWWNIYRCNDAAVEPVFAKDAEFGLPQWVFGLSTFGFTPPHHIICAYCEQGTWKLGQANTEAGTLTTIDIPYMEIRSVRALPGFAYFIGGSPTESESVIQLSLDSKNVEVLRRSNEASTDSRYVSVPQALNFPSDNGLTCHALFYHPHNDEYAAPEGEKPPLLILCHSGPTGSTSTTLDLRIQYWTSRGFAVLDVNYRGSTGFGRVYRQRLEGQWGIGDVNDCLNGARYLVEKGIADGDRVIMRGSSAGGYTTLCALTFHDLVKAGASYYGISDLEALVHDGHKFESRYLERLVGPYPESRDRYRRRSPVHFADRLSCPVIFFQGLSDTIVSPPQAEMMVEALRQKGLPVAYETFQREEHGFRRAETIKRCLEAELYFFAEIFGFALPEDIEPVEIENLE
jgi:dipeptidyl aminopeptidase/acylaminoacyl peptidase